MSIGKALNSVFLSAFFILVHKQDSIPARGRSLSSDVREEQLLPNTLYISALWQLRTTGFFCDTKEVC